MNPSPAPLPAGERPAASHASPLLSARAAKVVLVVALMTATSGYFMGLRQLNAAPRGERNDHSGLTRAASSTEAAAGVPRIVEYRRLGERTLRPNADWKSSLASLKTNPPPVPRADRTVPALPASDQGRFEAVSARASRRAFDGAPPVIPHPVDAITPASCRTCHLNGLAVRGVVAPKMSHAEMGSCTQCHVPQGGFLPAASAEVPLPFGENAFDGLKSAGRGARAWPGAPPTIPHTLAMRQDCGSCHGPAGLIGLRTSHPERAACQQCHVPDGQVDVPPWIRTAALMR